MAASIDGVFQPEMQNIIKTSKILLVGAGGIGCEVLKNLVMTGFREIELIDLDTIEVSNLNRQFLFNKESVGKAKSHVARETVLKFNPNVNIISHFGDIMDQNYGGTFFSEFQLVINALDNKKARNHVNRMCLSCNIPLIESGTMGYSGQVELIKKGLSQCYECLPKAEPKSYPMCTIRNTPKEPIHCIIWAKFLFGQLFGDAEEDVSMEEQVGTQDMPGKVSARDWAKINNYDSKKLCKKIFIDDINYLLKMPDLFKQKIIEPFVLDESLIDCNRSDYVHESYNQVLSVAQYVTMFIDSVDAIKEKLNKSPLRSLVWDKDDDDFMNFVVASSNIRSEVFHIPLKSHFDIKSMAGNIIPAIATANAIVAGQIVIHALRVLEGRFERCQSVFLRKFPNFKGGLLVKDKDIQKPNPKCSTCASDAEVVLSTDLNTFTLKQFEDLVLKKKLNMVQPDVIFNGNVLISSDEEDEIDMTKTLFDMGVQSGSRFTADDYHQNYSIKIIVQQKDKIEEEDPDFIIFGNLDDLIKAKDKELNKEENVEKDDDDCLIDESDSNEDKSITNNEVQEDSSIANDDNMVQENDIASDDMVQENDIASDDMVQENDIANDDMVQEADDVEVPEVMDAEVSNEEKLAMKRKAEDDEDLSSEAKKSRTDK